MNKKIKLIIVLVIAIVIIAVAAIVLKNNIVEPEGKDLNTSGGVADNIFDNEDAESEDVDKADASDEDDGNKSNDKKEDGNSSDDKAKDSNKKDNGSQSEQNSSDKPSGEMDYEKFHAMSPSKQQEYIESFDDIDDFFDWYNKAKKKYEKEHPDIEIDSDEIELE